MGSWSSRSVLIVAALVVGIGLASSARAWPKGADELPFRAGQVWTGEYVCSQGLTQMWLRIMGVEGRNVRAIWEFHHVPSGIRGSFWMNGTYQPTDRRLVLRPGQWIDRPRGWVSCTLAGTVSPDGRLYSGRVTSCSSRCTWFRVSLPAR